MDKNDFKINVEKIVNHWVDSSKDDFNTMMTLYESKSFAWALFIGHISVEKLLKAVYVNKFKKHAPFTHNLYRLAELTDLEISIDFADWLDEITSFNLNARYDDYKKEFYHTCTQEYAEKWINRIKILHEWIVKML